MFRIALDEIGERRVDPENGEISEKKEDPDPKNVKSLKELYHKHPTIFVIIILLSGFNSETFKVVQNNFTIQGVSYSVEFKNEELSKKLLSCTEHVKALIKD